MNNNYPQSDKPMQPGDGSPYYSQWQSSGEYGQQQPDRTRKPYQFPGSEQQNYGQGYPGGPRQGLPQQDEVPVYQPTQPAGTFSAGPSGKKPRRPRKKRGCLIGCLSTLAIFILLFIFLFISFQKVLAFGHAISNQDPLSTQTGYMGGSNRVNILMMGYGGAGHDGAYLTDSLVIMSLIPSSHHTTLISVPRDLWVQNPAGSGNYSKINAVYSVAAGDQNQNPIAGGNAVAQKVSLVTGLQINYWMTINFAGFKDFIDAIGGIDVNVPDSFNACYPKNDDASVDPSWIKVQFNQGLQHMDGATAIEYARAREPVEVCGMGTSENQAELTDFGRSRRQQLIMQAALAKLKNWGTWPHLFSAMDKLEQTLYSNLSLADLGEFALKMDLNDAHRVGLSNDNVLADTTSSDGQDILLPQNNDWALIPAYIQQQLYK
jgi:polyisoprenyl-teichoic acid--peptidoglycan teichoic acid transferase